MTRVDCHVFETSTVCLQAHMKRYGVACRILPIWNACWNFPVFLILSCDLPWRTSHDNWRLLIISCSNLLMLMLRRLKWICNLMRNLYDAFHSPFPRAFHWCIPYILIFHSLFLRLARQKRRLIFLRNNHTQLLRSIPHILASFLITRPTQIHILKLPRRTQRGLETTRLFNQRLRFHFLI